MGSLASPIAPHPIMEEHQNKRLHPFFTGERDGPPATPHSLHTTASTELAPELAPTYTEQPAAASGEVPQKTDRPQKRRKTDSVDDAADKVERRVRRKAVESSDGTTLAQITPNNQDGATPGVPSSAPSTVPGLPQPTNPSLPESAAGPYMTPEETPTKQPESSTDPNKAKKLIKFNPKTGTLGSPPRPKVPTKSASKASAKGRKSFLVCIKYGGTDPDARERIGKHIREILERKQGQAGPGTPLNAPNQPSTTTSKPAHPFFSKKSKKSPTSGTPSTPKAAREKPPRQVVFSSTPCSPKRSRVAAPGNGPQFSVKSTGLKVPGARLPLWPPQGMAHVRGLEHGPVNGPPLHDEPRPQRKLKGHSVEVADEESILNALTRSTDVAAVAASIQSDIDNANDILPPPKELRLPQKHFESGTKVQRRMRSRLKTYRAPPHTSDSSEDELGFPVHPIIKRLFNSLGTSLSSYDRSTCENSSWAHKYAPQTTAEILQPGKEGSLLREWLLSLKINSVDTGADSAGDKSAGDKRADAKARGKKKRKAALEGFIVDSDDEADELDEVSEGEEAWASQSDMGLRSVIRHGDVKAKARDGRLTNAVVISGPHGCGKTAAVYAIAKELDYEIFEINASSRRNGKDVLERVGDMTRNHLVHHQADETEDQTAEEVKSGKQGTMTSFFKPNAGKAQKAKPASPRSPKASGTKNQKQSLILLEEVDILYEEDKQFWVTITSLIAQSKRPFVMTCNDETLVPFQMLNLHGIFRFNPPPTDLAVDAMLLAAASEGHVLERKPVEELYETRGRDLRAALTELNYWCQIGVGDRRGGMDWFYLRWPAGSDRDENGDVVRVISEGTYQSGMGWFGDVVSGGGEEELVHESWDAWGVDCDGPLVDGPRGTVAGWSDFVDAMSAADMLSHGSLAQRYEVCAYGYLGNGVKLTRAGAPRRDAARDGRSGEGRLHPRPHAARRAAAGHLHPARQRRVNGGQVPRPQAPLPASPAAHRKGGHLQHPHNPHRAATPHAAGLLPRL